MPSRSLRPLTFAVTVALVALPSAGALAQAGLRGSESANDFPTSPTVAAPLSPESKAAPSWASSPLADEAAVTA